MSEPYLGEIRMVGFNFAPQGWATCDGQLVSLSQNQALAALLGDYYGGTWPHTFGLPDLRGRVPIHGGQGPGLTYRQLAEASGSETIAVASTTAGSSSGMLPVATAAPNPSNLQPYTVVNFIICTYGGYFPSRT